ncbi:hypothetical protein DIU31_024345 [Mucilaginibacter rubeus]|uniref:Substrate-binding domain-containing protein n=1 Tax=Mucilaginibacter rubeus TaxID=2027860 RepID=A0AAE6JIP0_9SPHI|nr:MULTISPECIES: substrate-binding domain-containing protein [Mucilaginibacter]QEM06492.1 hypothetical protein DIU31_024345 [Mucilaginibacter rubeus]QEM19078.1 hypothetical protein DIU38_024595 [Mucilaginibacter gossypii]QTE44380.1 substrate-binding domain-containing protein [Mucilaginibacter rubeus]QTE50979.1 substrate-binding domain-containing protein [Mucilaginibacter rubeus]QTE56063.1 substrate-binding domain-containing protein [Mucilaginibacter rubeus]
MRKYLILMLFTGFVKAGFAQSDTLHVYGPGGPYSAVSACAVAFTTKTGIPVKVVAGPEEKWITSAQQNADIIFEGAEYMLTLFDQQHPGITDPSTRSELYKRAVAILVRPGNPKHIKGLADLAKPGIKVLDVNGAGQLGLWEDLAGRDNLIAGIQKNIAGSFPDTALGIDAWKKNSSYDVWITYASWHENLWDATDIVRLPSNQVLYRGTPLAITAKSMHRKQALDFVHYMQGNEGHQIFRRWGWE